MGGTKELKNVDSFTFCLNDRKMGLDISPSVVIYHARCPDGFGAAWVYWQQLKERAIYVPALYGQQPPSVKGQDVVMVDVSFPRPVIERLAREAKSFRLLDHHCSAYEELKDLPCATFDLELSGVGLAWRDVHGDAPLPKMMACIQDRDLHQNKVEGGDAVLHVLDAQPYEFEAWEALSQRVDESFEAVRQEGLFMHQKFQSLVGRLMKHATPIAMKGYRGLAANAPMEFASDVGCGLSKAVDFGFTWFMDAQGRVHGSWRSSTINVIPLAKHYGGGGHPHAAGARLTVEQLMALLSHGGEDETRPCGAGGCGHARG